MIQKGAPRRLSLVGGVLLIFLGLLFALDNLGAIEAGRLWDHWPLFLLWVGLPKWLEPRERSDQIWGLVLVGAGTLFELDNFELLVRWHFDRYWPLLLVLLGAGLILQDALRRKNGARPNAGP